MHRIKLCTAVARGASVFTGFWRDKMAVSGHGFPRYEVVYSLQRGLTWRWKIRRWLNSKSPTLKMQRYRSPDALKQFLQSHVTMHRSPADPICWRKGWLSTWNDNTIHSLVLWLLARYLVPTPEIMVNLFSLCETVFNEGHVCVWAKARLCEGLRGNRWCTVKPFLIT